MLSVPSDYVQALNGFEMRRSTDTLERSLVTVSLLASSLAKNDILGGLDMGLSSPSQYRSSKTLLYLKTFKQRQVLAPFTLRANSRSTFFIIVWYV